MKIWINKLLLFSLFSLVLFACEKEEDRVIMQSPELPELAASISALELDQEQAEEEALTFTWTAADFGFPAAANYTLELAQEGTNFAEPREVSLANNLQSTFTVAELNRIATQLGLAPGDEGQIEARVRVDLAESVAPVYSNTTTISVTPYSTIVVAPSIFVPGAYQGWDPGTAPALVSVEDNGVYEGVVSFVGADNLEFKLTAERNWDVNYGQGAAPGTLSMDNAPNLSVPTADNYLIVADLNNLTWSSTLHSWGIIGSATAGGWDADTNMSFDSEEGVWKIKTDLAAGELKFRFNDDWGTNLGDDDLSNDLLNPNGANIPVAEPGTYEIVLDLRDEDNPVYSLTQL